MAEGGMYPSIDAPSAPEQQPPPAGFNLYPNLGKCNINLNFFLIKYIVYVVIIINNYIEV